MKRTLLALSVAATLGACGTLPPLTEPGAPPPPPRPSAPPPFRAADFQWSTQRGSAGIRGEVAYSPSGARYTCAGQPVILTPDAPYSRWRTVQLYGSDERAAMPVSVVRGRQGAKPPDEYSAFVKHTTCDGQGRFTFSGLPAGGWYVIVVAQPAAPGAEQVALMRHVLTRAGAVRTLVLE